MATKKSPDQARKDYLATIKTLHHLQRMFDYWDKRAKLNKPGSRDHELKQRGKFRRLVVRLQKRANLQKADLTYARAHFKNGTTTIDGHPVANWIVPIVRYARSHGWGGVVTSGYRSIEEQQILYARYRAGGVLAAPPGQSNHNYREFPRGAVDVSDYYTFGRIVAGYPNGPTIQNQLGRIDPVHFSYNGH